MLWLNLFRIIFVVLFIVIGSFVGIRAGLDNRSSVLLALVLGLIFLGLEVLASRRHPRDVLAFFAGLVFGLIAANLLAFLLTLLPALQGARFWVYLLSNLTFLYLFTSFTVHHAEELRFLDFFFKPAGPGATSGCPPKILDTSSIIDGRILGVAKSGFLEGDVLVPRFVLRELQRIADAREHFKRTRGRRGLDVLKKMQEIEDLNIIFTSKDVPKVKEVDQKLIELAKQLGARLITTDFNLQKLANLHGVKVLNVNELSKELKPILIPGDMIKIKVIKRGKEESQGIGYLEDGTMVVVENGVGYMGQEIECEVVSILQTEAGRMVFAKPKS